MCICVSEKNVFFCFAIWMKSMDSCCIVKSQANNITIPCSIRACHRPVATNRDLGFLHTKTLKSCRINPKHRPSDTVHICRYSMIWLRIIHWTTDHYLHSSWASRSIACSLWAKITRRATTTKKIKSFPSRENNRSRNIQFRIKSS